MEIRLADSMGFCFGVRRAIDLAENLSKEEKIFTLGPLIHNEDEIKRLKGLGVDILDDLTRDPHRPILIRSHGVGKNVYAFLEEHQIPFIDATCPFVKKIHEYVKEYLQKDYDIAILGDKDHPEVQGIISWGEGKIHVFGSMEAVKAYSYPKENFLLLAQTTLAKAFFDEAKAYVGTRTKAICINTICSATKKRQEAAIELAQEVDLMLIIGGKASSNTKKLYELCKMVNSNTLHIENSSEIHVQKLPNYAIIGISAGASTPKWVIDAIVEALQNERYKE